MVSSNFPPFLAPYSRHTSVKNRLILKKSVSSIPGRGKEVILPVG